MKQYSTVISTNQHKTAWTFMEIMLVYDGFFDRVQAHKQYAAKVISICSNTTVLHTLKGTEHHRINKHTFILDCYCIQHVICWCVELVVMLKLIDDLTMPQRHRHKLLNFLGKSTYQTHSNTI